MACSRHPSGREWIFPEGPGRLGTVMLAIVCPWRRGGGGGVCEGRDTHILLRVRSNLVATRRRIGGAPLKAWRMHSLYWATTVSHKCIPRFFHTIIRLRCITQAMLSTTFASGYSWCIALRETTKLNATQCLHNQSCYTITMFRLTICIYSIHTHLFIYPCETKMIPSD